LDLVRLRTTLSGTAGSRGSHFAVFCSDALLAANSHFRIVHLLSSYSSFFSFPRSFIAWFPSRHILRFFTWFCDIALGIIRHLGLGGGGAGGWRAWTASPDSPAYFVFRSRPSASPFIISIAILLSAIYLRLASASRRRKRMFAVCCGYFPLLPWPSLAGRDAQRLALAGSSGFQRAAAHRRFLLAPRHQRQHSAPFALAVRPGLTLTSAYSRPHCLGGVALSTSSCTLSWPLCTASSSVYLSCALCGRRTASTRLVSPLLGSHGCSRCLTHEIILRTAWRGGLVLLRYHHVIRPRAHLVRSASIVSARYFLASRIGASRGLTSCCLSARSTACCIHPLPTHTSPTP